jgi:hypothetical protein
MGYSVFPAASSAGAIDPIVRQTFNSTNSSITYATGLGATVFAVLIGGGGGGNFEGKTGGRGGLTFGYCPGSNVATIGAGGAYNSSGYQYFGPFDDNYPAGGGDGGTTSFSNLIATGGGGARGFVPYDSGGSGGNGTGRRESTISFPGFTGNQGTQSQAGSVTLIY